MTRCASRHVQPPSSRAGRPYCFNVQLSKPIDVWAATAAIRAQCIDEGEAEQNLLHYAVVTADVMTLQALLANGYEVDARDVALSRLDHARILVEAGANVNAANRIGCALRFAAGWCIAHCKTLLRAGVLPTRGLCARRAVRGQTPEQSPARQACSLVIDVFPRPPR